MSHWHLVGNDDFDSIALSGKRLGDAMKDQRGEYK
jgi:hypothetical protein